MICHCFLSEVYSSHVWFLYCHPLALDLPISQRLQVGLTGRGECPLGAAARPCCSRPQLGIPTAQRPSNLRCAAGTPHFSVDVRTLTFVR